MKDDFEKRLNDRITEVFDNFEDPSADASWDLLREKYPEKKKRRGVIWLWMGSAAAILLLLLGLGIWNGNRQQKSNKLSIKKQSNHQIATDSAVSSHNQSSLAAASSKTTSPEQSQQTNRSSLVHSQQAAQSSKISTAVVVSSKRTTALSGKQPSMIASSTKAQQVPIIVNEPEKTSTSKNNEQQSAAENSTVAVNSSPATNSLTDTPAKKNIAQNNSRPVKSLVKSPFTENDPVIKNSKTTQQADNSKTVTLGVYAATYLNYSSGSSSTVNVGAGVASDVKLAKNLKLSTGVAVNQNNLDFGNHIPTNNRLVAASTPNFYNFYNLTVAPNTNTTAASYPLPVLKNYSAQLTSLDVPLNLKYEFNPQQNSSFISLGVSSGTFITETYNSQYGYSNSANQTQSSNTSSFNSFYFAKTLDFSFGLGYPIGKNHLSVEPFVRYPLQGLGAEQIRFGAGGLNLKFNFSNNKK